MTINRLLIVQSGQPRLRRRIQSVLNGSGKEILLMTAISSLAPARSRPAMTTCSGANEIDCRRQQPRVPDDVAPNVAREGIQRRGRALSVARLAGKRPEHGQVPNHDRVGVGQRIVRARPQAHDHVGGVVGRGCITTAIRQPVAAVEHVRPRLAPLKDSAAGRSPRAGAAKPRSCWRSRLRSPARSSDRRDRHDADDPSSDHARCDEVVGLLGQLQPVRLIEDH